MLGYHQKDRPRSRFLQDLQQLIGGSGIHLLRLPDDHDLIAFSVGLETEFTKDLPTLFLIDHRLLVLHAQSLMPIVQIKIMLIENNLPPGFQKIIAGIAGIGLDDREGEMQVRMLQVLVLQAGRTDTAAVLFGTVRTIEVLRISEGQL